MNEKDPTNKSLPGVPEALHPEIGNGLFMEKGVHNSILRNPDPLKEIEARLMDSETNDLIYETWAAGGKPIDQIDVPGSMVASSKPNEILPEDQLNTGSIEAKKQSDQPSEDAPRPNGSSIKAESIKSKKEFKGVKGPDLPEDPHGDHDRAVSPKAKPTKAGKLIRKAAKTIKKQEEIKEDVRREEEKQEPIEAIGLSEQNLSPYTKWLKSLRGSDYVHPYDDDFAINQGVGSTREGISETFADLLAAQGYKEQAIEMYMKLIAKYPEKSGFFAAKIEALQ